MKKTLNNTKKKGARLGQHLLTSRAVARAVVDAVPRTHGVVLEVGPGTGMLTREILATGARVIAIEKDPEMVRVLSATFQKEIQSGQCTVIEGDIRDVPLPDTPYTTAANIPYYITGDIIRLLLTARHQPSAISLLIQKEVAERIARSKKESLLSLSVKAYGTPRYVKTVQAGSFNPPPSVDSAILAITNISRKNFGGVSEKKFFELLHAGFGQKRKTLLGNLKRHYGPQTPVIEAGAWHTLGLSLTVRAEDVPLETWLALAALLT